MLSGGGVELDVFCSPSLGSLTPDVVANTPGLGSSPVFSPLFTFNSTSSTSPSLMLARSSGLSLVSLYKRPGSLLLRVEIFLEDDVDCFSDLR